jgi:hypothetical protein
VNARVEAPGVTARKYARYLLVRVLWQVQGRGHHGLLLPACPRDWESLGLTEKALPTLRKFWGV